MSENKKLNNFLHAIDAEFSKTIGNNTYRCTFPYHGGVVRGETYPVSFGVEITDDDNNPNYINEVRVSNESNYINEYNEFLSEFKKFLLSIIPEDELDAEDKSNIDELLNFFNTVKPEFYSLEVSS